MNEILFYYAGGGLVQGPDGKRVWTDETTPVLDKMGKLPKLGENSFQHTSNDLYYPRAGHTQQLLRQSDSV